MQAQEILHFPSGGRFHLLSLYVGYFLLAAAVFFGWRGEDIYYFLLFGGMVLSIWKVGVRINPVDKKVQKYDRIFGIPLGKWVPLASFPYLGLLRKKTGKGMEENPAVTYEVYLLSRNHLKRFFICKIQGHPQALETVRNLSDQLDIPFVPYNPGKLDHQARY